MIVKKRPSVAFVVSMIALFVALGGTAGAVVSAAVPLAKHALVADNAKKLNGLSATQIGAAVLKASAQVPGPASTASGLVSTTTAPFSVAPNAEQVVSASCGSGGKAVGGGFANPASALVLSAGAGPTSDGSGWTEDLLNVSDSATATGTVIASCLK